MSEGDGPFSDGFAELLSPAEVARLFRVSPTTVTRWARAGLLPATRTLGGHRRFERRHVVAHLERLRHEQGAVEPDA